MTLAPIHAWLADLGEDDIQDWANKGLLRRGLKLAASAGADSLQRETDVIGSELEGSRQRLTGSGFDQLSCTCAAVGTCHHMIALLLLAKTLPRAATDPAAEPPSPTWLLSDDPRLLRPLGRTHLERAQRWMRLGVLPEIEEGPGGWVGEVTERETYRVRLARSSTPEAATCTCGAARCPHRALVALELRRRLGRFDPAGVRDVLSADQTDALEAIGRWTLSLAAGGLADLSSAGVEQAQLLATNARQADLPRVAAVMGVLLDVLDAQRRGRSFADSRAIAGALAALRVLITGLSQASARRPLLPMIGVNRALYRKAHDLRLLGVAAEHWQGRQGQEGISLHFHAPDEGRWYRLTETRRPAHGEHAPWTPLDTWREGRWADGPYWRELPAAELCLRTGWVSADGRLSGRPGTRIELHARTAPAAELPIERDFAALRRRFASAMLDDSIAPPPRLPVILQAAEWHAPQLDTKRQWWAQPLSDPSGAELQLGILIRDPINARKRERMDALSQRATPDRLVFGMLSRAGAGVALDPIALLNGGAAGWTSLTL